MLGRSFVWAATSEKAHGESFNIDNGDVWEFRSMWHSLSRYYNIPLAEEDESFVLDTFFQENESTWQEIVRKNGLHNYTLEELLGQSAQSVDILLNNCTPEQKLGGQNAKPWIESRYGTTVEHLHYLLTPKIRIKLTQAGFTECVDTEDMAFYYYGQMEEDKLLPTVAMLEAKK